MDQNNSTKGLALSREFFEEFGKPMLEENFKELFPYIAVGCVGSGSDRYGFDDDVSQDHDFEPGFCIFLPGEDVIDRKAAFQLERAYSKLPKEYKGFKRQSISPVGGNRFGIIRTAEFYQHSVGSPDGILTLEQWLTIDDYALAEAVNGEVFLDNYGEFTRIREGLKTMPADIRFKRLAGNLLIMAQSGQYNFRRCLSHGETEAAALACHDFVESTLKVFFLLKGCYMPYYKWSFRALRQLDGGVALADKLSEVLFMDHRDEVLARKKYFIIEDIASDVIALLMKEGITEAICGDLEKHAYSVNDHIEDGTIRNMHVLAAIV